MKTAFFCECGVSLDSSLEAMVSFLFTSLSSLGKGFVFFSVVHSFVSLPKLLQ